jgi:hypothetical protein
MKFESVKPPYCRFPVVAIPLHTLLFLIRLGLQTLIGVESTKEIPIESPNSRFLKTKSSPLNFDQRVL